MPHVDILYNQSQKRNTDSTTIKIICEGIFIQNCNNWNYINKDNELKREVIELCDECYYMSSKRTIWFSGHLIESNLFLVENFEKYFSQTTNVFPYFDDKQLKTELQIIYGRSEFRNISGAVSLLAFLKSEKITHTFAEYVKLLKIVILICT